MAQMRFESIVRHCSTSFPSPLRPDGQRECLGGSLGGVKGELRGGPGGPEEVQRRSKGVPEGPGDVNSSYEAVSVYTRGPETGPDSLI
eukprot:9391107-Pyramimonas_sp.AAC.2